MPYSFTQIEKEKSKTIAFVFSFLIAVYFFVIWLIVIISVNFFNYQTGPRVFRFNILAVNSQQAFSIFAFAFLVGYVHWSYTTSNLMKNIIGVLKAEKLNPNDRYHQMFKNIVDEVSVATGGRKMEPVIIPTMAMNAFAIADFSGQAVIGLTEGMLSRLTRAQIEAVVGHEAAHIVSGDCLETTVTSSIFELFNGILRGFEAIFRGGSSRNGYSSVRFSGRGGGGAVAFLLIIYALLAVTRTLSQIVRLFISRQREYRADAAAVRLTRDPLSLAEALYAISYRWRGGGLPAQELESIFIVNPVYAALDEGKGALSNLFSTHPPIDERLNILLDMAHSDVELVVKDVERQADKPRTDVPEVGGSSTRWMAHKDGQWQGPFDLTQLMTLGWLRPDTWVQRLGGKNVQLGYQDEDIRDVVLNKEGKSEASGANLCPKCHVPLTPVSYEGTDVHKCRMCRGTLVSESNIKRVIIRQEVGFDDRIKKIAEGILRERGNLFFKGINRDPATLLKCPKCQHPKMRMMRMFYTEVYRVEIDKCFSCGLIWFDSDELEILQCMIERSLNKSNS